MSIVYKYNLSNIGLGDLTFFCGEMLFKLNKDDILKVKIDKKTLVSFRDDSESYKNFCFDYIKYILSDYLVVECEANEEVDVRWSFNSDYNHKMLSNKDVRQFIKTKFSSGIINDDHSNYIILFTKVRDYNRSNYELFSKELFKILNNLNTKIILLGEKNVHYDSEYSFHGKDVIYSLYDDYIKNIQNEKILDLTKDDYVADNINVESIINDLTLISNSKKIIMIGGGGFWCTSLFTDKLISLNNEETIRKFNHELNHQIFESVDDFLKKIQNV
jgi:hypothetical protein